MSLKPTTQTWQSNLGQSIGDLITNWPGSGETKESIASDWSELVATPAMQMWSRNVAPFLRESLNIPGAIGRSTGQGLARAAEEFYVGSVQPTLFNAFESFKNRELNYQNIWASLLGTGSGLSTAQTLQYANKPSWRQEFASLSSGIGDLVSSGTSLIGAV